MTELLEKAFAEARALPEDRQNELADSLFAHMSGAPQERRLTEMQVEEVKRIQRGLRDGTGAFASEDEMNALWQRSGM